MHANWIAKLGVNSITVIADSGSSNTTSKNPLQLELTPTPINTPVQKSHSTNNTILMIGVGSAISVFALTAYILKRRG